MNTPTPVVCAAATSSTVPSGSPVPTSTAPVALDQVTILSANFTRTRGESAYTVVALDSVETVPGPILTLNATASVQKYVTLIFSYF